MTIVRFGKKGSKECMEFSFDEPMDAFTFYTEAIDHYREDDLSIDMTEEEKEIEMPEYSDWIKCALKVFGGDADVQNA